MTKRQKRKHFFWDGPKWDRCKIFLILLEQIIGEGQGICHEGITPLIWFHITVVLHCQGKVLNLMTSKLPTSFKINDLLNNNINDWLKHLKAYKLHVEWVKGGENLTKYMAHDNLLGIVSPRMLRGRMLAKDLSRTMYSLWRRRWDIVFLVADLTMRTWLLVTLFYLNKGSFTTIESYPPQTCLRPNPWYLWMCSYWEMGSLQI